jgi:hypothetical protein
VDVNSATNVAVNPNVGREYAGNPLVVRIENKRYVNGKAAYISYFRAAP